MATRHLLTEEEIHTLLHTSGLQRQPADAPASTSQTASNNAPYATPPTLAPTPATTTNPTSDPVLNSIQAELRQLRSMMSLGITSGSLSGGSGYTLKARILQRLVALGFRLQSCEKLLSGLSLASDDTTAWQQILISLQTQVPIARDSLLDHRGIVAFVGPTGSGKTTNIAKLAAQFVQRHNNQDIGLITTDYYSVSGRDEVCTYGRLLNIAVHRVNNRTDLKESLDSLSDKRLILIDTPGISQRDKDFKEKMDLLFDQTQPISTLLTLAATTHEKILDEIITSFSRIRLSGVSITKIDEAPFIGHILSACIENQLRIYSLTNGQQAPHDLIIATIDKVIYHALREFEEPAIRTQQPEIEESTVC